MVIAQNHPHQYLDRTGLGLPDILFGFSTLTMDPGDIRALPGLQVLFSLEPSFRSRHNFNSRLQLSDRHLNQVNELIHHLSRKTERKNPDFRIMAKGRFVHPTASLAGAYSSSPTEESPDRLRMGNEIAHIESRDPEKITLDELAEKSNLSTRPFSRVFQERIGDGPHPLECGMPSG